jgi:hypothetical protein
MYIPSDVDQLWSKHAVNLGKTIVFKMKVCVAVKASEH